MRSHKKLTLIIAAAILPNLAFGLGPDVDPAKDKKDEPAKVVTPAKFLDLKAAKIAFGDDFGAEKNKEGTAISLYGLTSEKCFKDAFEIKADAVQGEYSIFYKGGHEDCLDGKKQVTSATPLSEIARLSSKSELTMKLNGSFESLRLRHENPLSDRDRVKYEALVDADGATISHVSAAEVAEKKKKEKEAEVAQRLEDSIKFVTTCGRNLEELDVMSEVIDELEDVASIAESKKSELSAARKRLNAKIFAACKLQITRGRTDDLANCGERLKKLAEKDESYVGKVKAAYLDLVGRLMNSNRLTMEEAYDSAYEVIAMLREFDLSEKEEKDLIASERNLHVHFLRKGAMEGSESENFQLMREKALEFMLAEDTEECLDEKGVLDPRKRMAAACQPAAQMAAWLKQGDDLAARNQFDINQKLAQEKKVELTNTCRMNIEAKVTMTPAETFDCQRLIAEANAAAEAEAAKAKAALNANVSASGFGSANPTTPVNGATDATNTNVNSQNTNQSGMMNSVYTGQTNTVQNTVQNTVSNPVPANNNVTVNRVPLGRR